MKGLVTTNKGAEDIAALDIKGIIGKQGVIEDTAVTFDVDSYEQLAKLCYRAQSIFRGILLLADFPVKNSLQDTVESFKKSLDTEQIKPWLKTFKVDAERHGEHDFRSVDIANSVTGYLTEFDIKPDYDKPEVIFYLYIWNGRGYFGIDFAGFELAKRYYKLYHHPQSLKSITAYALVRWSGYKTGQTLVDPFMGSAVIPIEAALYAQHISPHRGWQDKFFFTRFDFFDEKLFEEEPVDSPVYGSDINLRFHKIAKKHMVLAEVHMNLGKTGVEWLDTRFEKGQVDHIVSDPPRVTKRKDEKSLAKLYGELFYQAKYVLSDKGNITLLARDTSLLEEAAKKHSFKLIRRHTLYQGEELFNVVIFR